MKIEYVPRTFSEEKLALIHACNRVINLLHSQGYDLTLRQLYYKLVKDNVIANSDREYARLSDLMNDARLAGLVDWDAIVDRTRALALNRSWDHPLDAMTTLQGAFAYDKWEDQPNYVEVWVEKDALKGIVGQACAALDVPYFSCRGYTSVTEMHGAALRFQRQLGKGREIRVLHLGDHDPSGIDMTRDIAHRIKTVFQTPIHLYRIALNQEQIARYQLPPNPAKVTDSRAAKYIEKFGNYSWELDSLDAPILDELIRTNVARWRDDEKFAERAAKEERAKHMLGAIVSRWNEVQQLLQHKPNTPIP